MVDRYKHYNQIFCDCTLAKHEEGEWVKVKELDKDDEFCSKICSNREEYLYMKDYGKKCPNCPVEDFLDTL